MVFFFLLVGCEIKREILAGELADIRAAALPIVAAAGGMLLTAHGMTRSLSPNG